MAPRKRTAAPAASPPAHEVDTPPSAHTSTDAPSPLLLDARSADRNALTFSRLMHALPQLEREWLSQRLVASADRRGVLAELQAQVQREYDAQAQRDRQEAQDFAAAQGRRVRRESSATQAKREERDRHQRECVIAAFRQLGAELGREPSSTEFRARAQQVPAEQRAAGGWLSPGKINALFGSFDDLCRQAAQRSAWNGRGTHLGSLGKFFLDEDEVVECVKAIARLLKTHDFGFKGGYLPKAREQMDGPPDKRACPRYPLTREPFDRFGGFGSVKARALRELHAAGELPEPEMKETKAPGVARPSEERQAAARAAGASDAGYRTGAERAALRRRFAGEEAWTTEDRERFGPRALVGQPVTGELICELIRDAQVRADAEDARNGWPLRLITAARYRHFRRRLHDEGLLCGININQVQSAAITEVMGAWVHGVFAAGLGDRVRPGMNLHSAYRLSDEQLEHALWLALTTGEEPLTLEMNGMQYGRWQKAYSAQVGPGESIATRECLYKRWGAEGGWKQVMAELRRRRPTIEAEVAQALAERSR